MMTSQTRLRSPLLQPTFGSSLVFLTTVLFLLASWVQVTEQQHTECVYPSPNPFPNMGWDPVAGMCTDCQDMLCEKCYNDYRVCDTCYNQYGLSNASVPQCVRCLDGCSTCTTIYYCTECDNVVYQGPNLNPPDGHCANCSAHCSDCSTSGSGFCDVCDIGWAVDLETLLCAQCAPGCPQCNVPGSCSTCNPGEGLTTPGGTPPADCALCDAANCVNCSADIYSCTLCGYGTPSTPTAAGQCYGPANDAQWIVPRPQWNAKPSKSPLPLIGPMVKYVIVHHTMTNSCSSLQQCIVEVQKIQQEQMVVRAHVDMPDIAYNFLIGEDGRVYEGIGWNYLARVEERSWHTNAIHIAFIGDFRMSTPNIAAMHIFQKLLLTGMPHNLSIDYVWFGHRDVSCTLCPGGGRYGGLYNYLRRIAEPKFRKRWGKHEIKCAKNTRGWMHPM